MEVFVARQPILNKNEEIFGYELLFRDGADNMFCLWDQDKATSQVIANSFLTMDIHKLTGGKRSFINFSANLLKSELATILPKELVVIEILENIEPDTEIITACRKLKELGYTLALDDFLMKPALLPLIEIADIVKIDFKATTPEYQQNIVNKLQGKNIKFLAEKIETREEYEAARKRGYTYFQGFFFSRPHIISAKDIEPGKFNYLQLLRELNKAELDYNQIELIVRKDISLSYKLLKFINSSVFGFKSNINSIKHALALLGVNEIKKWFSLITLRALGENKPEEIIISSYVRANFAELIAEKLNFYKDAANVFMMGLFSMIDALLDRPLIEILEDLPIATEIKHALLGEENIYRDIYDLIISYEKADWNRFCSFATKLNLEENEVAVYYLKALEKTNSIVNERIA